MSSAAMQTRLVHACKFGKLEEIGGLVEAKADINGPNRGGETALGMALQCKQLGLGGKKMFKEDRDARRRLLVQEVLKASLDD